MLRRIARIINPRGAGGYAIKNKIEPEKPYVVVL